MKRVGLVVLIGCLAMVVLVAVGEAHKRGIKTSVRITKIEVLSDTQAKYTGTVRSKVRQCVDTRSVRLTHIIPGKDFLIGIAATDKSGNWMLTGPKPPKGDRVKARVSGLTYKKNRNHKHRCKSGKHKRTSP
jgi:hypothetical protein